MIDLPGRLLQRIAGRNEVVALRHEKVEALGLFRVLFDRQRVHGADGVDSAAQPLVLLAQPCDIAWHFGSVGEELVE